MGWIRSRRVAIYAVALAAPLAAGCGVAEYDARLNQTKLYYAYLERVELNLAPKWSDGRIVDMIRVPRQFSSIPAPVAEKDADGNLVEPAVDPRQPDFLNLIFPKSHLVGAWEAEFNVALEGGGDKDAKGHIYVLSNYWMFVEEGAEAVKFTGQVIQLIGDALEEHLPEDKLMNPDTEMHPKPGNYLPAATYSVFTFKPKPITFDSATIPYTTTVYARGNGDIQCLVVVMLPEGTSSREKLTERIPMMLDHFSFTRTPPRPGQSQGAAQGPAAPAAGF